MTGNQEDEVIIYQIQLEMHNIDLFSVFIYIYAYIHKHIDVCVCMCVFLFKVVSVYIEYLIIQASSIFTLITFCPYP